MTFRFDRSISEETYDFENAREAERSPLATKIFGFPWTNRVFLGPDFVTITKQDWVDWDVLAEPLAGLLAEHLNSGEPVLNAIEEVGDQGDEDSADSEDVRQIKAIIKRDIQPVVRLDGGDIVFHKYENHVVYIHMKGSCSGCPSSTATLKDGIEVRLKELMPEIREVVAV
jgi:Fe-S cluster biogenesis protein NfuA